MMLTKSKNEQNKMSENDDQIDFRLVWGSDKNLQTVYANHFFISHAGDEFYLTFGELPAINTNNMSPSELREYFGEALEITPLVRLAVAPKTMLRIAEAIQSNVARYISKTSDSEENE